MNQASARRQRRTKQQWRSILEQYSDSSLSAPQFCNQNGLGYHSFIQWRKRLSGTIDTTGAPESSSSESPTFVELTNSDLNSTDKTPDTQPVWQIELDIAPGIQLRIAR